MPDALPIAPPLVWPTRKPLLWVEVEHSLTTGPSGDESGVASVEAWGTPPD